jgi:hypothetical protein
MASHLCTAWTNNKRVALYINWGFAWGRVGNSFRHIRSQAFDISYSFSLAGFWHLIFFFFGRTLKHFFLLITIRFMLDLATETQTSLVTKRWEFPKARFLSSTQRYPSYTKPKFVILWLCNCLVTHLFVMQGEVAINSSVDVKSYTSLHTLVNDMFPPTTLVEQVSCPFELHSILQWF